MLGLNLLHLTIFASLLSSGLAIAAEPLERALDSTSSIPRSRNTPASEQTSPSSVSGNVAAPVESLQDIRPAILPNQDVPAAGRPSSNTSSVVIEFGEQAAEVIKSARSSGNIALFVAFVAMVSSLLSNYLTAKSQRVKAAKETRVLRLKEIELELFSDIRKIVLSRDAGKVPLTAKEVLLTSLELKSKLKALGVKDESVFMNLEALFETLKKPSHADKNVDIYSALESIASSINKEILNEWQ